MERDDLLRRHEGTWHSEHQEHRLGCRSSRSRSARYWIHNLRLGYRPPDGRVEVAGWVRNVANLAYKTYAFDASTFNATTIYFIGDPRTYGGTVTVTF